MYITVNTCTMIIIIILYLHGYILFIFQFLLELIEPSLVINGIKLEDEIPFVLKFLG